MHKVRKVINMKNNNLYNCESAVNDLPMFAKNWIAKYIKQIPIKIPIRKNCMTGSGREGLCHWNVFELVKKYGGNRLHGFSLSIARNEYPRALVLTDHSIWITPESKVVDVTEDSRAVRDDYQFFIPVSISRKNYALSTVIVPENFKKNGISVNMRDKNINKAIAEMCNFKIKDAEKFTMNIPSSKFNSEFLYSFEIDLSVDNFHLSNRGHFRLPSTATGKYWQEIVAQ